LTEGERASGSIWNRPLMVAADGEVAELAARPGTSVEAGALVARVVDFRRVLVRLEMPPEALAGGPPDIVSFVPATVHSGSLGPGAAGSAAGLNLTGKFVGPAAQVDGASQRAAYWYEIASESVPRDWRPGYPVKAAVPLPGSEARDAVAVLATSLLYHQGYPLVYVRIDPGRYERRDVEVLGRAGDRWVLGRGVRPGEAVVSAQAQLLLSAEFNQAGDND
jgi:hypothetical protein